MKTLLDKIMNVLTRYDESTSAYITPTQEPFVRKELEEVVNENKSETYYDVITPDGINAMRNGDINEIERIYGKILSEDSRFKLIRVDIYRQHITQFGEKKEGGVQNG